MSNFFNGKRVLHISESHSICHGIYSDDNYKVILNDSVKIKSAIEYCDYLLYEADSLINKKKEKVNSEIRELWGEYEREKNNATIMEEKNREGERESLSTEFLSESSKIMKAWAIEREIEKLTLEKKAQEAVVEVISKLMKETPEKKKIKTLLTHLKLEVDGDTNVMLKCNEKQEKKVRDCLNILGIIYWRVDVDNQCKEYELHLVTKNGELRLSWDSLISLCNRSLSSLPGIDVPGRKE